MVREVARYCELQSKCRLLSNFPLKIQKERKSPPKKNDFVFTNGRLFCDSRYVATRGVWTARGYEILDLLGPDETKDKVSNQVYENLQAVKVLEAALDCEQMLPAGMARPAPRELAAWRKIAKEMFIPTHGDVRTRTPPTTT